MKNILEKISGIIVWLLGIGALIFFGIMFSHSDLWFDSKILPIVTRIFMIVLLVNIFIVLPLAAFDKTRTFSSIALLASSYIYGVILWFWGLILTFKIWGIIAVIIGLVIVGIGVVPTALIATIISGQWVTVAQLIFLILLTVASRKFSVYLSEH